MSKKKTYRLLPCSICGNEVIFKKDQVKKCKYCGHYSIWNGKEVINDDYN